jgi:hypothetical protein
MFIAILSGSTVLSLHHLRDGEAAEEELETHRRESDPDCFAVAVETLEELYDLMYS